METPQWSVEYESGECSVIVVTNTDVDPWAVVVHLHYTPDAGGRREEGGRKGGGRREGGGREEDKSVRTK